MAALDRRGARSWSSSPSSRSARSWWSRRPPATRGLPARSAVARSSSPSRGKRAALVACGDPRPRLRSGVVPGTPVIAVARPRPRVTSSPTRSPPPPRSPTELEALADQVAAARPALARPRSPTAALAELEALADQVAAARPRSPTAALAEIEALADQVAAARPALAHRAGYLPRYKRADRKR